MLREVWWRLDAGEARGEVETEEKYELDLGCVTELRGSPMALAGVLQAEGAKGGQPEENRSCLAHSRAHQACQRRGWGAALEDVHLGRSHAAPGSGPCRHPSPLPRPSGRSRTRIGNSGQVQPACCVGEMQHN